MHVHIVHTPENPDLPNMGHGTLHARLVDFACHDASRAGLAHEQTRMRRVCTGN